MSSFSLARTAYRLTMLVVAVQLPASGDAGSGGWNWYSNTKYGYAVCFPAGILMAQPEPDAHDGRTFSGRAGIEIRVYASFAADAQSIDSAIAADKSELLGGKVTYVAAKANLGAVSGVRGNRVRYWKHIQRADAIATLEFTYPLARAAAFRSIVEKMARCFKFL